MTAEQFTYWLQGFIETADPKSIDEKQTQIIKDHLKLVFTKVTPDYNKIKDLLSKPMEIKDYNQRLPSLSEELDWTWRPEYGPIC